MNWISMAIQGWYDLTWLRTFVYLVLLAISVPVMVIVAIVGFGFPPFWTFCVATLAMVTGCIESLMVSANEKC